MPCSGHWEPPAGSALPPCGAATAARPAAGLARARRAGGASPATDGGGTPAGPGPGTSRSPGDASSAQVTSPWPSCHRRAAAQRTRSWANASSHGHPGGTPGRSRIAGAAGSCGRGPLRSCHGYPPLPPGAGRRGKRASPCPCSPERVWVYLAASTARYIPYSLYRNSSTCRRSAPADSAKGSRPARRKHAGQPVGGPSCRRSAACKTHARHPALAVSHDGQSQSTCASSSWCEPQPGQLDVARMLCPRTRRRGPHSAPESRSRDGWPGRLPRPTATWCPRPDVRAEQDHRAAQQQMTHPAPPPPSPHGAAAPGLQDVSSSISAALPVQGGRRLRPNPPPPPPCSPQGRQCRQGRLEWVQRHREQQTRHSTKVRHRHTAQCTAHSTTIVRMRCWHRARHTMHSRMQHTVHNKVHHTMHSTRARRTVCRATTHRREHTVCNSAQHCAKYRQAHSRAHGAPQATSHSAQRIARSAQG